MLAAGTTQLFSQNAPQRIFEGLTAPLYMFHERGVDERLIVTAAALLHLPLEPSDYIIIKPNGDPSLAPVQACTVVKEDS
jgi:hypothetical protein